VKRLELYITETDDNDDSGFAEISIAHRCESPPPSPPPPPPPPPSPPVSPSPSQPAATFEPVDGALHGTVVAAAWPGSLGKISSPSANTTVATGFTPSQCGGYCGAFRSGARAQVYTGQISTLPHTMFQCTCFAPDSWTVVDASTTSGFVHGTSIGHPDPMLSGNTPPAALVEPGILKPSQGYIAKIDVPPTTTAFDIILTLTTHTFVTSGNVFTISPWRLEDCRPCLHISSDRKFQASIYYSEKKWWKFATAEQHTVQPNTEYTVRLVLHDRRLRLFVDYGKAIKTESLAEANAGLALAGEFPHNEKTVLFAGKGSNGGIADVFMDMDSLSFSNTADSQQTMDFKFDPGAMMTNSIRFHVGFEAPSLVHASQLAAYAASSPSTAVAVATGYDGGGVEFDRHAALVLQSSEEFLGKEFTLCVWMKRTLPLDTLFTTIGGFGEAFVVHYAAYFLDVSLGVGNEQLRASPTTLAEPGTSWTHVCASYAVGGLRVMYINGTRVGSSPHAAPPVSSQLPFAIGGSLVPTVFQQTGNDRGFGGIVDEVEAWDRQLSDTEVSRVFIRI
jgi:hypothetical protein